MTEFDTMRTMESPMPWGSAITAEYTNPQLHGYRAIMVADDIDPDSHERISTMITRFPRCILPEVNTHRVFSRNSASSRARSVRSTIQSVMDDPYIPLFTINHKGMGGDYLQGGELDHASRLWLSARDKAVSSELSLLLGDMYTGDATTVRDDWSGWIDMYYDKVYHSTDTISGVPDVHKQNANRLIEPFMWHEALITSTYWDNFFTLRIDGHAQPEMHAIAVLMKGIMDASRPRESSFHIPFVSNADMTSWDTIQSAFMESASECARISYKDKSTSSVKSGDELAMRMLHDGHMSPFEHQAVGTESYHGIIPQDGDYRERHGNLSSGWVQYRHIIGA